MKKKNVFYFLGFFLLSFSALSQSSETPKLPTENDYYKMVTLPIPEGIILEGGGVESLPDGRLAVATRRGEVWLIENPYMKEGKNPYFKLFAQGLHEILGLAYRDNAFYVAQRSELTKLIDRNGDDIADVYETVCSWDLSGNYHEYSFGPKFLPNGEMIVTFNVGFFDPEWWIGRSKVKWRGWMVKITPEGKLVPYATGVRSPAGLGFNAEGDIFYSDNQGDWIGSGFITHVEQGDFVGGNPAGLDWASEPNSPVSLKRNDITDSGKPLFEVAEELKNKGKIKPPSVWLPHGILGISTSDIVPDKTAGKFGVFENQVFVGDQGQSKIMRVFLEKVKGKYQGAVFPFREGFASGVLRMTWGTDGSMFVGQTNRGWASTGKAPYALQRLVWSGKIPFEIKAVYAKPDGFELEFTKPADRTTAEYIDSYAIKSFIYKHHGKYGSPMINEQECKIKGVVVSEDGMRARLVVEGLRQHYVHEIKAMGVLAKEEKVPLLHDFGYYTLNEFPEGEKITNIVAKYSPKAKVTQNKAMTTPTKTASLDKPKTAINTKTEKLTPEQLAAEVSLGKQVFQENCSACHALDQKLIGPTIKEMSQIYQGNPAAMIQWIKAPGKKRVGEAMPAQSHLSERQLKLVAQYILSVK
ncbi:c-type cytochrome [Thermoflexibacter ruber]|uniref:Glucose/arabinose dehydrogenase, beta-propeller fold n=1 Tax=Thermoflexibacter ruber TaxID=1003 RepID=A0A1I2IZ88_9BACT|nr:c-type cytochrome [Thermoflexibacter ruber]SFF47755.1 Glucose/arabinose dehydrogenase, beta-propeller fold [Thermoflexibacter ruber]